MALPIILAVSGGIVWAQTTRRQNTKLPQLFNTFHDREITHWHQKRRTGAGVIDENLPRHQRQEHMRRRDHPIRLGHEEYRPYGERFNTVQGHVHVQPTSHPALGSWVSGEKKRTDKAPTFVSVGGRGNVADGRYF